MHYPFHQQTFDLLGITPSLSVTSTAALARLEQQDGIYLPAAVRAWYSVVDNVELLGQLTFMHTALALNDLATWVRPYSFHGRQQRLLHFLIENQGVWHLALPLDQGADPPVYVGYDEATFSDTDLHIPEWTLHAPTFSTCIYAFAWDYTVLMQHPERAGEYFVNLDTFDGLEVSPAPGPETFVVSAFFVASRFLRETRNAEKFTFMADR